MTPAPKDGGPQGREAARAGMLEKDQPVYATAGALDYDSTSRVASTPPRPGAGQALQGDTTIQAARVTVDDATGNLAGTGQGGHRVRHPGDRREDGEDRAIDVDRQR